MNLVAPAGTPIRFTDIYHWLTRLQSSPDALEELREAICQKFNIKHCLFMSSGRAALSLVLQALSELRRDDSKDEVIVPAYTCYSVPASVMKAGFKVRVCDIDPATLSYDIEKLANFDFTRTLAIVSANLYGIPDDLLQISVIARANNTYLIDDAAQCMGGKIADQYSGTFGDAGLYSLDKGKNITSIQGGILVTNSDELAQILSKLIQALPAPSAVTTATDSLKLLAYAALLPPQVYWVTQYLPFLNLGKTVYTTDYPLRQYSPRLGSFALRMFYRLDELTSRRCHNAKTLAEALGDLPGLNLVQCDNDVESVDIRLPILVKNTPVREHLLHTLLNNGIGASISYPLAVPDIIDIKDKLDKHDCDVPGGRRVAQEIITLPTHPYVTAKHIDIITGTIGRILGK